MILAVACKATSCLSELSEATAMQPHLFIKCLYGIL